MERVPHRARMTTKLGLGILALGAAAVPLAAFATAEDPTAALSAEQVEKGRQLFDENACGTCHVLADAKASGSIGPAFDGNGNLDKGQAVQVITNGQGAMPNYGWLDPADIDLLAAYIVQAKK
jgi:mono/diheme cytochrome c family protein